MECRKVYWQSAWWRWPQPDTLLTVGDCCLQHELHSGSVHVFSWALLIWYDDHHHHKHQGLGHLARYVSRATAALSSVSLVTQPFSFPVGCSGMISKGFGFVSFFAGVKASSFYIHLSCPVYIQFADMIWYDMIYIYLTAVGLSPGGSSTSHIRLTPGGSSTSHIYTQTVRRIQRKENYEVKRELESASRALSLRIIPWHLPYNWG
jgi:hypothetical protein